MFYYAEGEFFDTKTEALKCHFTAWEYDCDISAEYAERLYEGVKEAYSSSAYALDDITGWCEKRLCYRRL